MAGEDLDNQPEVIAMPKHLQEALRRDHSLGIMRHDHEFRADGCTALLSAEQQRAELPNDVPRSRVRCRLKGRFEGLPSRMRLNDHDTASKIRSMALDGVQHALPMGRTRVVPHRVLNLMSESIHEFISR
jgi:hypothetical protein